LLKELPPEHVNTLLRMIRPLSFKAGEVIVQEGKPGTDLLFIVEGTAEAFTPDGLQAEFGPGSTVAVISLIMDRPHPATGVAKDAVTAYALRKDDLERLRGLSPAFDAALRALTQERLQLLERLIAKRDEQAISWLKEAGNALATGTQIPDQLDLRRAVAEHKGAPLAIWLGILLDGIPESFVIGAGLLALLQTKLQVTGSVSFGDVVPYTLIAGLFLSNFPEALASSASMRLQGFGKQRVLLLWSSLLVVTALGAGVGFLVAESLSHTWVIFAEGLAAGAMLTMIAAAMIPEAVHMGKAGVVGLSTLGGFLAAISFKLLE